MDMLVVFSYIFKAVAIFSWILEFPVLSLGLSGSISADFLSAPSLSNAELAV